MFVCYNKYSIRKQVNSNNFREVSVMIGLENYNKATIKNGSNADLIFELVTLHTNIVLEYNEQHSTKGLERKQTAIVEELKARGLFTDEHLAELRK